MFRKAATPQAWPSVQGTLECLPAREGTRGGSESVPGRESLSCQRTNTASLSSLLHVGLPGEVWTKISQANAKLESHGISSWIPGNPQSIQGHRKSDEEDEAFFHLFLSRPFGWVSACLLALAWGRERRNIDIKRPRPRWPLFAFLCSVLSACSAQLCGFWPLSQPQTAASALVT